jgi:type II secretory pathway pseudopilin PulG
MRKAGVTLVDLLITLAILTIMALIALPLLGSFSSGQSLRNATGELVSAITYTRSLAIQYNRPFSVSISATQQTFSVVDMRYFGDPAEHRADQPPVTTNGVVINPADKTWFTVALGRLTATRDISISLVSNTPPVIPIYGDGHSLAVDALIRLSSARTSAVVKISGGSGFVSVSGG